MNPTSWILFSAPAYSKRLIVLDSLGIRLQSLVTRVSFVCMKNSLNIRTFPPELNKAAKIAAVKRGVTLRQFVIDAIKAALETK